MGTSILKHLIGVLRTVHCYEWRGTAGELNNGNSQDGANATLTIYLQDNPLLERQESRNHFASKPSSLISDYASRCQELVLASQKDEQITRHTWALLA